MSQSHQIRHKLAILYRYAALKGWDDLTYTHISARVPGESSYYIYPFGMLYGEVTPENLLHVTLEGRVLEGSEHQYNQTGYVIHGSIYKARPDVNAIVHLHTPSGVAVSAVQEGLLPLSQWALHFYGKVAYHDYNSLALDPSVHGDPLLQDLGDKYVMMLRNHGTLTMGRTIEEAQFYTHHLELACKAQISVLSQGLTPTLPSLSTCEKAVKDLLTFEANLGERDWKAIERLVLKASPYSPSS